MGLQSQYPDRGCNKAKEALGHEVKCLDGCPFDPCLEMINQKPVAKQYDFHLARDINIIQKVNAGASVEEVAKKNHLSTRSVYRIMSEGGGIKWPSKDTRSTK